MTTLCAKHVVIKAASNAATVNFMVVVVAVQFRVRERLEPVDSLYKR